MIAELWLDRVAHRGGKAGALADDQITARSRSRRKRRRRKRVK